MSEDLRQIPLASRHVAHGGKMVPFAGFSMPLQYSGIVEEHHAVRRRAGLFDVSHMGEVEITGPDAIAMIDALVSNDATRLVDGQAMYTVMCREDGGIVDDLIVYRLAQDHVLVCVNAANRDKDFAFMKAHARGEAELVDRGDAWAQLALQGPLAQEILAPLTDADLGALATFRCTFAQVAGVRTLVARTGYTGEDGFELYIPTEAAGEVFDALVAEGQKDGRLSLCGLGCRDTLRLEARLHLYGQDMDESINPLEAGLSWVVKLNKSSDFVGRQALERIKQQGVSRRLKGLVVEGKGIIRHDYPIFVGDVQVGKVTSGTHSPTLEQSIGLGYVDVAYDHVEEVEVEVRQRRIKARVTTRPFYSRK